jgi:cytochrome c-type biogenesis protein CcmH
MLFWISSLILLFVASLCVVLPLTKKNATPAEDSTSSLDFYKDQIKQIDQEIEREKKPSAALLSERAEIARRMLREARREAKNPKQGTQGRSSLITTSLAAVLGVPLLSISLYFALGASGQSDFPLSARANLSLEEKPVEDLVQVAERHLAKNPNDAKGWRLLADVYGRLNKPGDRARALRQVMRIDGETPELLTDLGEALTIIAGNIVPAEARQMFDKAASQQPNFPKPQIFIALALDQEGKPEEALRIWEGLAKLNTNNPRWAKLTSDQIARLQQKAGLLQGESERPGLQEINAMVEGLASRLEDGEGTVQEWSRLIRSYMVLDEPVKASLALEQAKKQYAQAPDELQRLDALAKQLNVADIVRSQGASE